MTRPGKRLRATEAPHQLLRGTVTMRSQLLTIVICLLLAGCTGPADPSDSKPPTAEWNTAQLEGDLGWVSRTNDANATSYAAFRRDLRITWRAKDPGGIQSMDIGGSASWRCSAGRLGTAKELLLAGQTQTFTPVNGNVQTEFALMIETSTNFRCPAGSTFDSGSITMIGNASDLSGAATSGKLTLLVRAPCLEGYCGD